MLTNITIEGVAINSKKSGYVALSAIYGIGESLGIKILSEVSIDYRKKAHDWTEEELQSIRKCIKVKKENAGKDGIKIGGDLGREIAENIKRLKDIGCYRGERHLKQLPCRGQRTRTNCRTKKGAKKTVANKKKETK